MNGLWQQERDDLRARVVLACAGYNLSPDVSEAVRKHGPQAGVDALTIPTRVIDEADEALAMSAECGVTLLTPAHEFWPWVGTTLVSAAPLVVWATGQLEILGEPLIRVADNTDEPVSKFGSEQSTWAALETATGLADAGHVLIATTHTIQDQLVLRAATAMGGRSVAVTTDLLRETNLAALGSSARTLVLSATPPTATPGLHDPHRAPLRDAAELLSRLATATVDPGRGWTMHDGGGSPVAASLTVLR